MEINVFDTYVETRTGRFLHFDVLIESKDQQLALKYANNWLEAQGIQAADIKQNMCAYCHTELAPPEVVSVVKRQGYFIIDLTG
ncbi:Domain of uncharacterised function (DUF2024) [Serratia quinivorans]|jgi:predicted  nucleic acid-binding Zn-ribbon protein|uniref:DUF2024 family protein n=1 Tax=Serratia quinivorans TaxID=137545 RepID=A0ABV3UM34_9GAMM|nr:MULTISPECIES: DUF2024 family protein [Serratia]CAI1150857.1 Domain of uncharacterised function (DUF2024) [Serratia quinivorans]CAI1798655.1 Domain of uncharacterised function (DUF2024) [Serratia quinivorans]CAI1821765.1 Domain of uncharacterised function (DUF2024) [Serratia quinivorans]CAI2010831.1 Domain of uncharacterised function (DUF2024) [Serratia quinivorans]